MKHVLVIFVAAIALCSCAGLRTSASTVATPETEKIDQYLRTADHLKESQQIALKNRTPFIGMAFDEALLAMTLVHTSAQIDEKILKGSFVNPSARHYVLFFDGGQPNRVIAWSAFTDEEFEEFKRFRETRPLPPLIFPPN